MQRASSVQGPNRRSVKFTRFQFGVAWRRPVLISYLQQQAGREEWVAVPPPRASSRHAAHCRYKSILYSTTQACMPTRPNAN